MKKASSTYRWRIARAGGCLVAVAWWQSILVAQARYPGFDFLWLPAFFTFLYFRLITSKFLNFQLEARCSEYLETQSVVATSHWYLHSDKYYINVNMLHLSIIDFLSAITSLAVSLTCKSHPSQGVASETIHLAAWYLNH